MPDQDVASEVEAQIETLNAEVRDCQRCELARTRNHAVPGEGPLDAEVMLIGEAPGVNEDRQGRPFVGQAGAFLGELLGEAGLSRPDVFICNVLKCRPPGNRDPLPTEIEECSGYLSAQIRLIDPLLIVTLGRFSMARFFPNQAISRIHGRPREANGRVLVPMYHPAAALHQQRLRSVIIDDFRTLPDLLERARASRSGHQAQSAPEPDQQPPAQQIRLFD